MFETRLCFIIGIKNWGKSSAAAFVFLWDLIYVRWYRFEVHRMTHWGYYVVLLWIYLSDKWQISVGSWCYLWVFQALSTLNCLPFSHSYQFSCMKLEHSLDQAHFCLLSSSWLHVFFISITFFKTCIFAINRFSAWGSEVTLSLFLCKDFLHWTGFLPFFCFLPLSTHMFWEWLVVLKKRKKIVV